MNTLLDWEVEAKKVISILAKDSFHKGAATALNDLKEELLNIKRPGESEYDLAFRHGVYTSIQLLEHVHKLYKDTQ